MGKVRDRSFCDSFDDKTLKDAKEYIQAYRELGELDAELTILYRVHAIHQKRGNYQETLECLERMAEILHELGEKNEEEEEVLKAISIVKNKVQSLPEASPKGSEGGKQDSRNNKSVKAKKKKQDSVRGKNDYEALKEKWTKKSLNDIFRIETLHLDRVWVLNRSWDDISGAVGYQMYVFKSYLDAVAYFRFNDLPGWKKSILNDDFYMKLDNDHKEEFKVIYDECIGFLDQDLRTDNVNEDSILPVQNIYDFLTENRLIGIELCIVGSLKDIITCETLSEFRDEYEDEYQVLDNFDEKKKDHLGLAKEFLEHVIQSDSRLYVDDN